MTASKPVKDMAETWSCRRRKEKKRTQSMKFHLFALIDVFQEAWKSTYYFIRVYLVVCSTETALDVMFCQVLWGSALTPGLL